MLKLRTLLVTLFLLTAIPAFASDFYYANTSAGSNNGTSCSNAYAYSDGTNGWNASAKQAAGNNLHVCGTITISANGTAITGINDGSSGSPITIKFETGSVLQSSNFNGNGAIYLNTRSWWVVDGGTNGIIQNTDNGSSPTYGHQTDSVGIYAPKCSHCEIKNLTVSNIYVKNTADGQGLGDSVDIGGSTNTRIDHNVIHDAKLCSNITVTANMSGIEVDHNTMSHCNWGMAVGNVGGFTLGTFTWHDNDVSDWSNWDDPLMTGNNSCDGIMPNEDNCFHHNGLHIFMEGSSGTESGIQIYNNYFHGAVGVYMTANIFLEANASTMTGPQIFNNVFSNGSDGNSPTNGMIQTKSTGSGAMTNPVIYNNTLSYTSNVGGKCAENQGATNAKYINNIFVNCGQAFYESSGSEVGWDYNSYYGLTYFGPGAAQNTTFSGWKSSTGFDANGLNVDPGLTSFIPSVTSSVYRTGSNLTSLGITPLNTSLNGLARLATGGWTIGANDAVPISGHLYYVSPSGTGSLCTLASPCAPVTALPLAVADDIIFAKNGTYVGDNYMFHPPSGLSGTSGHPITIASESDGGVYINGQGARAPILFVNNSWWVWSGFNAANSPSDVIAVSAGSSNNIFRRFGAWNASATDNYYVVHPQDSGTDNNLFEDFFAFGTARKVVGATQGPNGTIFRRGWAMWNYSSSNQGPKLTYSLAYNSYNTHCENCIGTWDSDGGAGIQTPFYGIFGSDHMDGAVPDNSGMVCNGCLAYVTSGESASFDEGLLFGVKYTPLETFKNSVAYTENTGPAYTGFYPALEAAHGGPAPAGTFLLQNITEISTVGTANAVDPEWQVTNRNVASSVVGAYGVQSVYINDGTKGATLCKQIVNNVVTATALWPWPMTQRIKDGLTLAGRSVKDVDATVQGIFGAYPSGCGGASGPTIGPQETFSSYTSGTDLDGLNGGLGFISGWVKSASDPFTVENAPTNLTGKYAKSTNSGSLVGGYYRPFTPTASGFLTAIIRSSVTNNNNTAEFELGDDSASRMQTGFTSDGNLRTFDGTTSTYTTLGVTTANANNQLRWEWDNVNHPNQYRVQLNHNIPTSWLGVVGSYSTISTVGLNDKVTNTHDFWVGQINGQSEITLVDPNSSAQGSTVAVSLTGNGSSWVNASTNCSVVPSTNITITSTSISDSTHGTCAMVIAGIAATGARDIYMTTGSEVEVYVNGFTIAPSTPPLTVGGGSLHLRR